MAKPEKPAKAAKSPKAPKPAKTPKPAKQPKAQRPEGAVTKRLWARALVAVLSLAIMSGTAASGYVVKRLDANIQTIDTSDLLPEPSDSPAPLITDTSAMNLLVMGSDSRAGQGAGFGTAGGARSDTTLIVHLYKGRQKALVVSIPRDSLVTIPPCKNSKGQQFGTWRTKFNAAFSVGGPVCTIKTIKSETGLTMDQFIVVDFKGFKNVVDALGGVRVCLSTPTYDPKINHQGGSGLNLPAGWSTVTGDQALAFVRARETLGDGSDLSRIQRQQEFIGSMMRGVKERGLLKNPTLLLRILNQITSAISTSKDLASVEKLSEFALSLANLDPANINFVTTPYSLIGDGNVHWTSQTSALWRAIKADKPYGTIGAKVVESSAATTAETPLAISPKNVHVKVLNGSGSSTLFATALKQLKAAGFKIDSTGKAKTNLATSTVQYNPQWTGGAETLAYAVDTLNIWPVKSLGQSIVLTVGADWVAPRKVVVARTAPGWQKSINAGTASCTQGNNKVKTAKK